MARAWITPRKMPPASAPSGRPKPPTIAAMKPLMAKGTPRLKAVYCVGVISTPAKAPSAALKPERQRQHARYRNALQRRGVAIDRAGPHRLAGLGR